MRFGKKSRQHGWFLTHIGLPLPVFTPNTMMLTLSTLNLVLFVGLVVFMAGLTLYAIVCAGSLDTADARALFAVVGLVTWLSVPFVLAKKGWLADFSSMPAPFMKVLLAFTLVTVMLSAFSPLGKSIANRLSLHSLFAFQVFRLALELLLLLLHEQGLAPIQMTLEGHNWDMVTGVLALGVLVFFRNRPPSRTMYTIFNIIGLGLLVNVVAVGFLSLPTPFQVFPGDNTWITRAPFIWLPTFLVEIALAGHLLSLRKILMKNTDPD